MPMEVCKDFSAWRELSARLFPGTRIAEAAPEDFHGAWSAWSMGEIGFHEFFVSAPIAIGRHADGRTTDAPPVLTLFLVQSGMLRHRQFGREAASSTRALSLVDGCSPYAAWQSANFHSLVVNVPTGILQSRHGDLRPACVTPRSAHFGGGSVLWNFLINIWQRRDEIAPGEVPALSAALLDLMGVLFHPGEAADSGALARNRTRLLDHISAHLPDPQLGVASIAAALGLSTRHVHTLMEATGKTLSRYILEQRLEQCMKALGNPLLAHLTITEIALQWGFNDMSHFSRVFRGRYGESPRTRRQRLAGQEQGD
ncbi:helix-turn-helix domain-containing protein [Denitratisoma sp. DHT3]|uniref:helix-turn-helix domain-containing protein n=1 Tax=Denitratisoma sp. DHT3 TaxID=1981880 RepID=UPI001646C6E5|nr:helix-turn-helix domain-containing protein [Denitratisoma sp. DHT3]